MEVKYLDLAAQFKDNAAYFEQIKKIIDYGQFVLGPAVDEFEKKFADFCGVRYAIGVSNGTDALFLAMKALGIGEGDEVITAPNSFLASAGAIVQAGAFPRFVDVCDDYNIDPYKLKAAITKRTKAILPVHLTGKPAKMDEVNDIAQSHKLFVIEDAAQAVGADIRGKKTGSFGNVGCFSLHPLKNLNTCGDGGVITTDSDELNQEFRLLRNHGLMNRNEAKYFAYCMRLDSIKAKVAELQIDNISEISKKRIQNAGIYDKYLNGFKQLQVPLRDEGVRQVFHTYVVQVEERERLIAFLAENGVETKIHYPVPIHLMEACGNFGYKKGDFPVTEKMADRIISLPVHQYLSEEQINYVIEKIYSFYGRKINLN